MSARDSLAEYNRKRDFKKTAEPAGKRATSEGGNRFIVQKHDATRLHWDFRIEADGVLKSWAVTKGPSPDPEIKRLAVRTEDHPLSYAEFEGSIPKGEYGGGTVMLWDKGTWAPVEGKSWKDIDKGHLHFTLEGERMNGEWILIRLKPRGNEKRENWLLRKIDDAYAAEGDPLVEHALTSVLTGRTMAEIEADAAGEHSLAGKKGDAFAAEMKKAAAHNARKGKTAKKATSGTPPKFRKPQLATLVDSVPGGNRWMHEIKFDGYRALVAAAGDRVQVWTRNGKDWSEKFGPLVEAFTALDLPPCLIDGEIVAYGKDGNPDFSSLQAVLKRGHGSQSAKDKLSFHAFDLLEANGEDLTGLSNIERKERLEALLAAAEPPIQVADHVLGAGEKLYRAMCDAGQEGIISKAIDAPYRSSRTKSWVKVKCTRRQEFVIIGWKKSSAKGRPFSSLLLAQHEGKELIYKGNVGTGFSQDTMADLAEKFARIERKTPPAEVDRVSSRGVTWLTPKLVAEIAFAEFTADGNVRHGSFLGLRDDKKAAEVVPERADEALDEAAEQPETVEVSSRDRVIFPESGQTKGELADYYAAIAPLMLPWAAQRPISLVRCPQGRGKKCFFQKHDSGSFGRARPPRSHRREGRRGGGLPLRRGRRRPDRLRPDGHDRVPRLGFAHGRRRKARPDDLRPRPRRGTRFRGRQIGRDRHPRSPVRPRPCQLRHAIGRQGRARRGSADHGPFVGGSQGLFKTLCRGAEHGRTRSLRRDDEQGQAQGQDLHRLPAQPAREHRRAALFGPRPRRGAGGDSDRLGRAEGFRRRAPVLDFRYEDASDPREGQGPVRLGLCRAVAARVLGQPPGQIHPAGIAHAAAAIDVQDRPGDIGRRG